MPTERLTFDGRSGGISVLRLDLPDGPHLATALFAHCFACGTDAVAPRRIARRLLAAGIAVAQLDFTGLGTEVAGPLGLPPQPAETALAPSGAPLAPATGGTVETIAAAAAALTRRDAAPTLLIGHSLAGAALVAALPQIPGARALVTLGAPFRETDAAPLAAPTPVPGLRGALPHPSLGPAIGPAPLTAALERAAHLALLVLHAPQDEVVPMADALRLFAAASAPAPGGNGPRGLVTLDGADHMLTGARPAEDAARTIAGWVARHLDLRPPAPPPGAPEGVVTAVEAGPRGFLQDVTAGPFLHLGADEPPAYGGNRRGMTPYQMLSAALASSAAMTVRLYARRRGWPLEDVRVEVSHGRVHGQDAAHPGAEDRIDRFQLRLTLSGPLDEAQRARLRAVAERCPVQRSLTAPARIDIRLDTDAPDPTVPTAGRGAALMRDRMREGKESTLCSGPAAAKTEGRPSRLC